jgi:hypothetical protein
LATIHIEASTEDLETWLKPSATIQEQVLALEGLGLAPSDIARATSVTTHALRSWLKGTARPRPGATLALDDLRATARILLGSLQSDGRPEPERVANWLRGWNPTLEGRPLDLIAVAPGAVRAAALGEDL